MLFWSLTINRLVLGLKPRTSPTQYLWLLPALLTSPPTLNLSYPRDWTSVSLLSAWILSNSAILTMPFSYSSCLGHCLSQQLPSCSPSQSLLLGEDFYGRYMKESWQNEEARLNIASPLNQAIRGPCPVQWLNNARDQVRKLKWEAAICLYNQGSCLRFWALSRWLMITALKVNERRPKSGRHLHVRQCWRNWAEVSFVCPHV